MVECLDEVVPEFFLYKLADFLLYFFVDLARKVLWPLRVIYAVLQVLRGVLVRLSKGADSVLQCQVFFFRVSVGLFELTLQLLEHQLHGFCLGRACARVDAISVPLSISRLRSSRVVFMMLRVTWWSLTRINSSYVLSFCLVICLLLISILILRVRPTSRVRRHRYNWTLRIVTQMCSDNNWSVLLQIMLVYLNVMD